MVVWRTIGANPYRRLIEKSSALRSVGAESQRRDGDGDGGETERDLAHLLLFSPWRGRPLAVPDLMASFGERRELNRPDMLRSSGIQGGKAGLRGLGRLVACLAERPGCHYFR